MPAVSGSLISNTQKNQDTSSTLRKKASKGFFLDILSDENGVSIHRFQNLVFNFVLGFVFLNRVYENLFMPTFDETILSLMGISASTYVALKATENNALTKPTVSSADTNNSLAAASPIKELE